MKFTEFLDHVQAIHRKMPQYPPLLTTNLFFLGNSKEFTAALKDVKDDLFQDCRDGIPMPYEDISTVIEGEGLWCFRRLRKIDGLSFPATRHRFQTLECYSILSGDGGDHKSVITQFAVCGVEPGHGIIIELDREVLIKGIVQHKQKTGLLDAAAVVENVREATLLQALDVAAISHPMNYIVSVDPKLSPREERREQKKGRPFGKSKHFIVIDHDVLVSMWKGNDHHASPVPHHRRGHWMRLAERCRQAKALGREKVWVRPAFVGDARFSDSKNLYEVLPDFGKSAVKV